MLDAFTSIQSPKEGAIAVTVKIPDSEREKRDSKHQNRATRQDARQLLPVVAHSGALRSVQNLGDRSPSYCRGATCLTGCEAELSHAGAGAEAPGV